jgi:hypothetical protein
MQFSEIYFRPFRGDPGGYSSYIWCDKSTMCFSILQPRLKNRIIALLNGEDDAIPFLRVESDEDYIVINGSPALLVRGWGRLIGCGGFRLEPSKAIKLQQDFVKWTIKQLKKNE